jgi:peptide/nickel transport system substrate-binding protein
MGLVRFAVTALAVFAFASPAVSSKKDNSIRFASDQVLESVDPYFNNVRLGFIIGQQVWDTLIYRDPKSNQYSGQLATSWRWIDDKTLELELRKNVTFHNGEAFDADDVVYTMNFVSRPDNGVVTQQNVDWIAGAEKVGKHTVRILTKRPFPAAIEYLAGPVIIYPNEYHAKAGRQGMNERPVGSGPYRIVEHALGKHVRLERNPDYFKDGPKPQPKVNSVEIRFIPDAQTRIAEVLSGGVDMIMSVAHDQAQQMRATPNLQVVSGETMRIAFLQMNSMENSPAPQLRDIRVRKAIMHAIDRDAMTKFVVGKGSRVLHTVCFPAQFGCTDDGAPRYEYDPVKARLLLAEAGFPNGFDIDLYGYRERMQTEAMIEYLRAVGIRANLRYMQYPAMREALRTGKAGMAHYAWGSFSINDVSAATPVFYKSTADDINRDAEVIALLTRGDSSVEPQARKDAYRKALALLQERAYVLPLYSLPTYYVAAKDLDFVAHPDELPRFWEMKWK